MEFGSLLRALADRAVTEGRTNWDLYYGSNNTEHLSDLEEWPEYRAVLEAFNSVKPHEQDLVVAKMETK